jgi:hypothetical protein
LCSSKFELFLFEFCFFSFFIDSNSAVIQFPTTGKYLYADASNSTLDFSSGDVSDAQNGALASTLQQTYGGGNVSQGWIFYNDEPSSSQLKSKLLKQIMKNATQHQMLNSSVEFGHSKGVVGWDQTGGYWYSFHFCSCFLISSESFVLLFSGLCIHSRNFRMCLMMATVVLPAVNCFTDNLFCAFLRI